MQPKKRRACEVHRWTLRNDRSSRHKPTIRYDHQARKIVSQPVIGTSWTRPLDLSRPVPFPVLSCPVLSCPVSCPVLSCPSDVCLSRGADTQLGRRQSSATRPASSQLRHPVSADRRHDRAAPPAHGHGRRKTDRSAAECRLTSASFVRRSGANPGSWRRCNTAPSRPAAWYSTVLHR